MNGIKTITAGDTGVGKTSIIIRASGEELIPKHTATIGAVFTPIQVNTGKQIVTLDIWDTGGQEKYKSVSTLYFREAMVGIFVFDITSQESFNSLPSWIELFSSCADPNNYIFIVANKSDMIQNSKVNLNEARQWAENNGYIFYQVSALTGEGLNLMFAEIAARVKNKLYMIEPPVTLKERKKQKCC